MKKKKNKKIKVGILIGYGDNCDCLEYGADCVVLYGGECDWRYNPKDYETPTTNPLNNE